VSRAYRSLLSTALLLALVVVSLGAYVRLSDAGLGCPDWPGCYGQLIGVPEQAHDVHAAQSAFPGKPIEAPKAWKEMIHRYAAGTLGLAIAALAVLAWRSRTRRRPWLEIALVGVVLVQALLGMLTVTKLLKPVIVTSHLLGGMSTLALLALLWLRERRPGRQPVATPPGLRLLAAAAVLVVLVQIALGGWVSSNYAAAICADFPTCQGSWWPELDTHHAFTLDRELGATASGALLSGAALTAIHWTHRLFAGLVLIVVGGLGLRLLTRAETRNCGRMLLAALGLQIGLGIANVLLQLPLPLAVAHNTGAALLLCATLTAVSRVFTRNEARGRFPAAGFPRRFQVVR